MVFKNVSAADDARLVATSIPAALGYVMRLVWVYTIPIIASTSNWWDAFFVYSGLSKTARMRFRNGDAFELAKSSYSAYLSKVESYRVFNGRMPYRITKDERGVVIDLGHGKSVASNYESVVPIVAEFTSGDHDRIEVDGKEVVDIGAYVGDSALYYIVAGGASKVYAYEPVKRLYELAKGNAELNNFRDRMLLYNEAVTGENKKSIYIEDGFSNGRVQVDSVSLDAVVARHRINGGALKIDCEGGEYEIIRSISSEALKHFDRIHIEYHYGYKDIVERLRKEGYKVRYTSPKHGFANLFRNMMVTGDIIATL